MSKVIIADVRAPEDEGPTSLVLSLEGDVINRLQQTVDVIHSGALGPHDQLAGVELNGAPVFGHPASAENLLDAPDAVDASASAYSVDAVLVEREALPTEEDAPDGDLDWDEPTIIAGHVKVDEEHLWIIGFTRGDETRVATGPISLSAIGIRLPAHRPENA